MGDIVTHWYNDTLHLDAPFDILTFSSEYAENLTLGQMLDKNTSRWTIYRHFGSKYVNLAQIKS